MTRIQTTGELLVGNLLEDSRRPAPAGVFSRDRELDASAQISCSDVRGWLDGLLEASPSELRSCQTALHWREAAAYWSAAWSELTKQPLPGPGHAIEAFRRTLAAGGDLSAAQIDQFCQRVASCDVGAASWLASTTERFISIVRPWLPLWLSFGQWLTEWCRANSVPAIAFLARDALPFFDVAAELEDQLDVPRPLALHLVHSDRRADYDAGHLSEVLRKPALALVDSGCYGTCMARLARRRNECVGGSGHTACLFFFSRNPQIFGYMNYLMSTTMLRTPADSKNTSDFVIYAGDLLEAMPKPYRWDYRTGTAEPTDLLSFVLGMSLLRTIRDSAAIADPATLMTAADAAHLLYLQYRQRLGRKEAPPAWLFDAPTPKSVPAADLVDGDQLNGVAPQDRLFGTAAG